MSEIQKHITPTARRMIKAKGLETVLDSVMGEIRTLPPSDTRERKVEVEWDKDPEIEGWEMLSVTLWSGGPPEYARNLWHNLDQAMKELRKKLSKSDVEKLNKFVSVGVDME